MNYDRVKKNWVTGLWDKAAVKRAYQCGIITKEQYKEIVALTQASADVDIALNVDTTELKKIQANIDYIAVMTGVDLT
jgi:hypothetical protein